MSLRVTWPLELGEALPWLGLEVDGQKRRGACAQSESPAPGLGEANATGGGSGAPLRRAGSSCQMVCGKCLRESWVGVNDQNALAKLMQLQDCSHAPWWNSRSCYVALRGPGLKEAGRMPHLGRQGEGHARPGPIHCSSLAAGLFDSSTRIITARVLCFDPKTRPQGGLCEIEQPKRCDSKKPSTQLIHAAKIRLQCTSERPIRTSSPGCVYPRSSGRGRPECQSHGSILAEASQSSLLGRPVMR